MLIVFVFSVAGPASEGVAGAVEVCAVVVVVMGVGVEAAAEGEVKCMVIRAGPS